MVWRLREERYLRKLATFLGADDNSFALGGHSLRAVGVSALLRDILRVELPLRAFFERPTVSELSGLREGQGEKNGR